MIRDLKHQNVVLTAEGQAKLADFGLGRLDVLAPNSEWTFGSPPGTPGWAAPDLFRNRAYTFTCDFYSMGGLLWVLLTGGADGNGHPPHRPVGGGRSELKLHQHDHLLLRSYIDHPRDNNTRSIQAGPHHMLPVWRAWTRHELVLRSQPRRWVARERACCCYSLRLMEEILHH